jgi:hypothetical protein
VFVKKIVLLMKINNAKVIIELVKFKNALLIAKPVKDQVIIAHLAQ